MITSTPANSIFKGPITNLLSVLCILIEVLSRAQVKGEKGLINFKFGTFTDHFLSDSAASMALKGLTCNKPGNRLKQVAIPKTHTQREREAYAPASAPGEAALRVSFVFISTDTL